MNLEPMAAKGLHPIQHRQRHPVIPSEPRGDHTQNPRSAASRHAQKHRDSRQHGSRRHALGNRAQAQHHGVELSFGEAAHSLRKDPNPFSVRPAQLLLESIKVECMRFRSGPPVSLTEPLPPQPGVPQGELQPTSEVACVKPHRSLFEGKTLAQ